MSKLKSYSLFMAEMDKNMSDLDDLFATSKLAETNYASPDMKES